MVGARGRFLDRSLFTATEEKKYNISYLGNQKGLIWNQWSLNIEIKGIFEYLGLTATCLSPLNVFLYSQMSL